jgi:hypothetical protein
MKKMRITKKIALVLIPAVFMTACKPDVQLKVDDQQLKVDEQLSISGELTIDGEFRVGDGFDVPDRWVHEKGTFYVRQYMSIDPMAGAVVDPSLSSNKPIEDDDRLEQQHPPSLKEHYESMGYYVSDTSPHKHYSAVYVVDISTGEDFALCNRPDCTHDNRDCVAYLPYPEIEQDPMYMYTRSSISPFLFADDEYIYAYNGITTVYRLSLDGSSRTEHMKIPDEYHFWNERRWIMNDKLYMDALVQIPIPGKYEVFNASALIEVDYINKMVREIWQQETEFVSDVSHGARNTAAAGYIIGLWDGKFYFGSAQYPPYDMDTRAFFEEELIIDYIFFSLDPADGKIETLFEVSSAGREEIIGRGNVFITSVTEKALLHFNLPTKEKTVLSDNLDGNIQIDSVIDNRLLMQRVTHNADTDVYALDAVYYYEFETGKYAEITLREKCSLNGDVPMTIFRTFCGNEDERDYFYVIAESEWTEHQVSPEDREFCTSDVYQTREIRLGRIPKADYWNNNADAIKQLNWEESREVMEGLWASMGTVRFG